MDALNFVNQLGLKVLRIIDECEGQRGLVFVCAVPNYGALKKLRTAINHGVIDNKYIMVRFTIAQRNKEVTSTAALYTHANRGLPKVWLHFTPKSLETLQQLECVQEIEDHFKLKINTYD